MKKDELDKIILTEMVKQIGDLGNYILKAIITIYGISLVALVLGLLRFPAKNSIENITESKLFPAALAVFIALNIAIWWVTKTFIISHIYIVHTKQNLLYEEDTSENEPTQNNASEVDRKERLIKAVFWVDQCPQAARMVAISGIMFIVFSLVLTLVTFVF